MAQTADSLTVAAGGALITQIPSASISRIRSSLGKSHGTGAVKGAKIGAIIGAGVGVLAGVAVMNTTSNNSSSYTEFGDGSSAPVAYGLVGALEGGVWGLLIGAIVGAEKWTTVYAAPVQYGMTHSGNRTAVGLSIRY